MSRLIPLLTLCVALASVAEAAVVTEVVEYELEGTKLEGFLAYDDAFDDARPGVLIVHQWMGLSDNERMRARMLAEMGYVAFALDVYGRGIRPSNSQEASAEAGKFYADPQLYRSRVKAGLEVLERHDHVDAARMAAIGYCFGGTGVLELARSGAEIAGVVSFHGGLDSSMRAAEGDVKTKVLVCHGAVDPYVKPESVDAFVDEMEVAGADYQLIMYAGAVHAFTQKGAGDDPSRGAAYDAAGDRRSWEHMKIFFAEIFQ